MTLALVQGLHEYMTFGVRPHVKEVDEVTCDQFFHIVAEPCMHYNSSLNVQVLKFAPSFETANTGDAKEIQVLIEEFQPKSRDIVGEEADGDAPGHKLTLGVV